MPTDWCPARKLVVQPGTPAATISVMLSPCVGLGCYSTFFPLLLLAAEVATQPSGHVATHPVTATIMRSGVPQSSSEHGQARAPSGAKTMEGDTSGLSPLR